LKPNRPLLLTNVTLHIHHRGGAEQAYCCIALGERHFFYLRCLNTGHTYHTVTGNTQRAAFSDIINDVHSRRCSVQISKFYLEELKSISIN
jgi:hypothetical protein